MGRMVEALLIAVCAFTSFSEARLGLPVKRSTIPRVAERTVTSGDAFSTLALPHPPPAENSRRSAQAEEESDAESDDDDEKGDPAFKPVTGLPPRQASVPTILPNLNSREGTFQAAPAARSSGSSTCEVTATSESIPHVPLTFSRFL